MMRTTQEHETNNWINTQPHTMNTELHSVEYSILNYAAVDTKKLANTNITLSDVNYDIDPPTM